MLKVEMQIDFLDLEVEINGQTYIVQVESYLFPELFEQL